MRLTEIIHPQCVVVPLEASDKQQAIFKLVDCLAAHSGIAHPEELKQSVWQREQTRTTGIGHGVAIPHGRTGGVSQLCMAVGRLAEPIAFDSVDHKPVELIFLLASPVAQTGPHIQTLAAISRMLTDTNFRAALKKVTDPGDLYRMLVDHEAAQNI